MMHNERFAYNIVEFVTKNAIEWNMMVRGMNDLTDITPALVLRQTNIASEEVKELKTALAGPDEAEIVDGLIDTIFTMGVLYDYVKRVINNSGGRYIVTAPEFEVEAKIQTIQYFLGDTKVKAKIGVVSEDILFTQDMYYKMVQEVISLVDAGYVLEYAQAVVNSNWTKIMPTDWYARNEDEEFDHISDRYGFETAESMIVRRVDNERGTILMNENDKVLKPSTYKEPGFFLENPVYRPL